MEKRTFLALLLSFLVIFTWQALFVKKTPVKINESKVKSIIVEKKTEITEKEEIIERKTYNEEEYKFENKRNLISFSNVGGTIKEWIIKEDRGIVNIIHEASPFPENIEISGIDDLKRNIFELKKDTENNILYSTVIDKVLIINKRYDINEDYVHKISIGIKNKDSRSKHIDYIRYLWKGKIGGEEKIRGLKSSITYKIDEKIRKNPSAKEDLNGLRWIGMGSQYFMVAILDNAGDFNNGVGIKAKKEEGPVIGLERRDITLEPGDEKIFTLELYAGPKRYTLLKGIGYGLEKSIDFGLFSYLSIIFLKVLMFLFHLTGNYGWSIIIMTCVIQVFMSPLSRKSFKSMQAMKNIQPKVNELRVKYKDDPKRLNIEMMNLYKSAKVNPFGGCLPMLLQLPIFWALFMMLRNAEELRNAPFIFWIKDLSSPDGAFILPFVLPIIKNSINILPILMGIAMFIQQKITSPSGDPAQAKMMVFMPVFFLFIFWGFPSGLVLYWLVNNILSIAQQWMLIRKL